MPETRNRGLRGVAAALVALAVAIAVACGGGAADSSPAPRDAAARAVAGMGADALAGMRIASAYAEVAPPPVLRELARRDRLAAVVLFAWNAPSRSRARRSLALLQRLRRSPAPLLAMVDQEGGQVKRLGGAPSASALEMGRRGPAFARAQGRRTAANLRDVGFNVDLAPVLDVPRAGGDIADTDRGFSARPARVSRVGVAFARGLMAGGVASAAKHFPGLGAARRSTDLHAQRLTMSRASLRRVDEAPFRAFAAAGGDLVMLSSAIYPALSPRPAAFSRAIVEGELRGRVGFEGVAMSDALNSGAVLDFFPDTSAAALAAAAAGVDLLLITDPAAAAAAHAALAAALRSGDLDRGRFERSAARVLRLRERLAA